MKNKVLKNKLPFLLLLLITFSFPSTIYGQVNGYNATIVEYSSGSFIQTSKNIWKEIDGNNHQHNFTEIGRDEWSIYLFDQSRDIPIQLDLYLKEIYIYYNRPNRGKLYNIVRSSNRKIPTPVVSSVPKGYTKCANENGSYHFNNVVDVAYGANGKYIYKRGVSGTVNFNNGVFGDPIPGVLKSGYFRKVAINPNLLVGPTGYTKCANENGTYYFNNRVDVAYGANGKYAYKRGVSGTINFNNRVFGDPIPGVQKFGYYKLANVDNPVVKPVNPIIDAISPISNSDMKLVLKWIADEVADEKIAYCYKNSYGRGVGRPLSSCHSGTEKDGLLCYPKCKSGFFGVGPVCWQKCPSGFRDDGGHCAKPGSYGRGFGYPWKFGDGLNLNGAKRRCEAANRQGCQKSGEIMYPKCKKGFKPFGCCVCSPICPSGMLDIGVSCQKQSYGRTAGTPMKCASGLQEDAGLCYPKCKPGYYGVGPVCWQKCPANQPVDCAAGCAKSIADCVEKTASMVTAVGELAANIITMGSTSKLTAAKAGLKTALKAGDKIAAKAALKLTVKEFVDGFERLTTKIVAKKLKEKFKKESVKWVAEEYAKVQMKLVLQEEFSVEDLRDLAGLDPTGVAEVVNAFWQPICSKGNAFPVLSRSY